MIIFPFTNTSRLCIVALWLTTACGCSALRSIPQPSFYSLDSSRTEPETATRVPSALPKTAPTLIVNPPHAASGYDSKHIIYSREAHKLEYFAHSEWIDTPARMLAPLIVSAIEKSGMFRAVVLTPSAASGELRLDTEIVRMQQDFDSSPSRVHFTLRAYLVDNATRQVLAWREFDETVVSSSDEPYGGVVAANRAVRTVLEHLTIFCAEISNNMPPAVPKTSGKP